MATQPGYRVVVTGSSGFVGGALVAHLHGLGRQVVALARARCEWPANIASATIPDYEDAAGLARVLEGAHAVVHLAARAHRGGRQADFECNERAAAAVARASHAAGVQRLVFMSSIGVNGNFTHARPFSESDAPSPAVPYAVSKLRSEQAVVGALAASSHTSWVILRPPLIYGPDAPGNFSKLVRAVERGWILPLGAIRNSRSLIGLRNLLDLVNLCLDHPAARNELFLAADGEALSTPELVRHIAAGLGAPARMSSMPEPLLRLGARMLGRRALADSLCASLRIDASKARRMLGWVPGLPAADGIRQAARESRALR